VAPALQQYCRSPPAVAAYSTSSLTALIAEATAAEALLGPLMMAAAGEADEASREALLEAAAAAPLAAELGLVSEGAEGPAEDGVGAEGTAAASVACCSNTCCSCWRRAASSASSSCSL
jgi:hypothetical protein